MSSKPSQPSMFLSYAHEDQAAAQRLAAALQKCGYTVWWDALIEGGTRYAATIDEALQTADAVLVLWSRASIASDWVRDEAAQGRERHRLVPLSLDGTEPPLGFRQIQTIDISRWRGRVDARQLHAIRRAIASVRGEPEPRRITPIAPHLTRRQAIVGGAAAAVGGGALLAWQGGLLAPARNQARSIAVLPFKNLSGDADQAFLSDGLTEEIRAALAHSAGLMVLAGTSSNTVRDDNSDARTVARKLGVHYLLDGSVQRVADRVRVAANLTNGRTGFSVWSQRVERRLGDIFAFQTDIAAAVSHALSIQMATDAPMPGGTRNAKALEAYLRGKALFNMAKDEESDREARANYEVAITADPKFALAHAGLSRVLAAIAGEHAEASELKPLYSLAVAEAKRAIDLAPTRAEGHLALGYARFAGFLDVRGARPSYEQAYRHGRGDADVVLFYALYTVRARRFGEARDAIERALALDPLNPRTHRAAGTIAFASRRYADAIPQYRRALELNPKMSLAHAFMGDALMELGKLAEARAAYELEPSDAFRLRGLAVLEHRLGNRTAAEHALAELVRDIGDAAMYQQAEVMAQWGRHDEALARLKHAKAIGDSGLSYIATDPLLDPLANDPRFVRFVKDIGFA